MSIYVYIYKCLSIQLDQKMHFQDRLERDALQVRTEYYSLTLNFLQFLLRSTFLSVFHN